MSSYSSLSSSISAVPSPRPGSAFDAAKSNRSDSQEVARGQKRECARPPSAASASSSSSSSIQKLKRGPERKRERERIQSQTPLNHAVMPSWSKARLSFPPTPARSRTPRPSSSPSASSYQFKNPESAESLSLVTPSPGHDLSDLYIDADSKVNRNRNRNSSSTPVAFKFRGYAAVGGPPKCNEAAVADVDVTFRSLRASVPERPVHVGFQAHQSIIASRSSAQPTPQVASGSSYGSNSSPKPIVQVPASPRCSTPSPSLVPQRHLSPATARLLRNTTSSLVREASTSSLRTSAVPSLSSSFSDLPSTPSPPSRVRHVTSSNR